MTTVSNLTLVQDPGTWGGQSFPSSHGICEALELIGSQERHFNNWPVPAGHGGQKC